MDLLLENDRNIYACSDNSARHLSAAVDTLYYIFQYKELIGGVLAINRRHFQARVYQINGPKFGIF